MEQLRFTIPEILSLIGVVQCVYIIVYVMFRAGDFVRVVLPLLYFLVLGLAFLSDFGRAYIGGITPYYDFINRGLWFSGPPLSVLLIIQMAQITRLPAPGVWIVLFFVPAAYVFARVMALSYELCPSLTACPSMTEWLSVGGLVAGAASLLMIWGHRTLFTDIRRQKAGRERYWLVLALIIVNVSFLGLVALRLGVSEGLGAAIADPARTVLGLSFVYLVTTSLFRIYPQALSLTGPVRAEAGLTPEEAVIAGKIEDLLALDKIYHEPTYSRSDLAQELGAGEAVVSRVINAHFNKSFPQLLNERRVEDAKRLLLGTDAGIKIVAQEVGFNSLPSFNRVFKDITGQSPSAYRKEHA